MGGGFEFYRAHPVQGGVSAAGVVPAVMAAEGGRLYQPRASSLVIESGALAAGVVTGADACRT